MGNEVFRGFAAREQFPLLFDIPEGMKVESQDEKKQ
jgi:hypothetical protein